MQQKINGSSNKKHIFYEKNSMCANYGSYFGAKTWLSTSKYKRVVWLCSGKYKNKENFKCPHFTEGEIKEKFIEELNTLLLDKKKIIEDISLIKDEVFDTSRIEYELDMIADELNLIPKEVEDHIHQNMSRSQNQHEYNKVYN